MSYRFTWPYSVIDHPPLLPSRYNTLSIQLKQCEHPGLRGNQLEKYQQLSLPGVFIIGGFVCVTAAGIFTYV